MKNYRLPFIEDEEEFIAFLQSTLNLSMNKIYVLLAKLHELYFNPNNSIAFVYTTEFVKSLEETLKVELTPTQRTNVLTKLWLDFNQDELIKFTEKLIEEEANGGRL